MISKQSYHKIIGLLTIVGLLMFSCKKEKDKVDFHFDYFGIEEGRFIEYDVVQITHDLKLNKHDTLNYRLKTKIGDTVVDNSGRVANKFYRSFFDTLFQDYIVKDAWTIIIDDFRGELVEENQRIIKMIFAPTRFKEWNINSFTDTFPEQLAYYQDIHKPKVINGFSFDSTVTVEIDSTFNLVQYKRKYDVYAKGIGLVKKHFQDLIIKNFDYKDSLTGTELFYTIRGFGFE